MPTDSAPKWLDRHPIVDADHVHHLETLAAINEFANHLPRHEAEAAAHETYKKDQISEAAAHHLVGMHLAHAAGNMEHAKKHGIFYALACKQLGCDPAGEPLPEVAAKAKNLKATSPLYKFKVHSADAFSMPEEAKE